MIALPGVAIDSKIYESAASVVYRGIREQDGQAIVVKLLKQDYPSPQELTRYRQEYEITRSLNLPGVVKAYSQQDYQRTIAILLEDFGGESIERWMRQRPEKFCPMPLSNFFRLAIDITEILGGIHHAEIVHKDINPSNIVFNPDTGVVKFIDFGIATQFNRTNPTFKSPHVLEGTLAYISPEQTGRMNRWLDYRTDFYSLGVTFYQLLTGQLPFPTTDILELVHCHIAKTPVPPHELNAAIPKAVSDIIMKLMAKNAEDRYGSAWGIKADLETCDRQFTLIGRIDRIQLGLQDISGQFHIPQKLYGREAQIRALLAAFDRVAVRGNEDNAQFKVEMMLVSGYSGVGKTALVQELYKPIAAKHGYFVWGKFDQFDCNIPYSAIADALRKLVQQLLGEPDKQVQQWRDRLLTALGSNGQIIIDVIPEVELIIGKQPPVPEVGATEAQNRFNLTFQKFVRVFCSRDHPLVIFLDDLQWIDSATLKLIELILLDEQTQYLFLIGAYRDNEVTPTHPLVLTLLELRKGGAVLQEITLAPLTLESLNQLIAETLDCNIDTVFPLAQLVLRKTEGNPFFSCEFLRMLYSENLLTFNAEHLSWQWNIAQIQARNITDNVVELLLLQLKKLPEETRQILRLAACVGSQFDLETLAIVCKKTPKAIFQNLLAAIQAGLIQPLSELDEDLLVQEYKFLHDRVQQAAYALIDESHKQVVHLQIGCNLVEKTLPEQLSERLFEIVDHLNHGIELVSDRAKRNEIARLNLMAGQKAKEAIAYSTASNYLTTGRQWLEASSWQTNYDLTLELYVETTEVAYLCGEFEQVEYWAAIVLQEAKTVLETVKVYEVKTQIDIAQNQPLKAINTRLQVLQQLGIGFPQSPTQLDVCLELDIITSLLGEKPIWDLIHLPKMTEPDKLAAMRILSSLTAAAHMAAPNLLPLLASKQVNLSIQYGNASVSPFAYATFGLILRGMVEDIESGYEFGQLALGLLSQLNTHSIRARTLLYANFFIIHWKKHARELQQSFLEAYQSALEIGDLEFAAYSAYGYCRYCWAIGKGLVELEREMTTYSEAIRQLKKKRTLTWNQIDHQSVLNLMGRSVSPTCLVGEIYNEEQGLSQYEAANDGNAIFSVSFNKLFLCYLFSEYAKAVENLALAERYLIQVISCPLEPLYYLYDSLVRLATHSESNAQVREEILEKVAISQEKMKLWADHAPMNYLHKYHLVEAEKARVLGQLLEAEKFYEQAIQGARENEYIQEEALAYELAAKHYLARGLEKFAQLYMKEAHYCYERWGAKAKVKDLENRYPQFFSQLSKVTLTSVSTTSETSSNRSDIALDLAAIMKASQAIAREIELEHLLRSLMQILIQNAGAQTGYLILEKSGEWVIEATGQLNNGDGENAYITQVLQSGPIIDRLPESIINYVIRTHESVILNDATREGNFIQEPYVQQHQTKSIFCLPLLNQAKLVGVLYLENQLAVGAFTTERTQVLNLLSTQAAIAIENAKLYSKLREGESRIAQFLEAVPVGIVAVDPMGHLDYFNQRAIQLLGQGIDSSISSEQISEIYQLYLAGTDRPYPTDELPGIRALNGECSTIDDVEIHQNNAVIPVEAWGTPVFDEQGNVIYAIATFQDITERKQAEKLLADYNRTLEQQVAQRTAALRQSEANYRNLIQTSNSVILRTDTQGRIRYVNDCGLSFFGYEEDQILGRTLLETIVPETETSGRNLKQFVDDLFDNLEAPLPQAYLQSENENLCRDGRRVWIAWSNQAILDEQGIVVEILSVGNDITQLKQAEEALQRSEAKFRTIFENSQVGIYRTRLSDGLILNANQRFAELLGFDSPEEIIGLEHTTGFNVNPNDRQQFIEVLKRDGEVRSYEIQMRKRDGTVFWGLFSSYLNAADDYIEGVIEDISDRKRAEIALQTSEERLRLALTAANQGLYDTNIKTGEIVFNPEYALMFGYDPATLHTTKNEWIESVHPDDRESVIAACHACLTGEVPNYQAEYRQRTQDGQWKWILSVGKVVTWNESGEPIRVLGVYTDIDDRKQAEIALQASEAELRALFSAIPDPMYIFNAEGQLICAIQGNPSYGDLCREEYIGKTLHQLYAKEQADEFLSYIQQAVKTQQILTVEYSQWIAGREIWFSARIAPIQHEQVIWLARDITLQKQAETASILEERNRMAREIHDTLAQAFTGILIQVGAATQVLTDDPEATQTHLDTIEELARTGLTEARRSVTALRPQLLESSNLSTALDRLVTLMRATTDTALIYQIQGRAYSLPAEVENNFLRIGQEALTNAIKYADASEIRIELVYDDARCCLRVKDDGRGFGVGGVPPIGKFGLLGMSERAERIGAQLRIESQPGQGTEIVVIIGV
ncbi:serine/threonine protein kinase [Cyanosarcina cf. burmensis CCALA 770]|nr:serine/threonine protein kinase [Cyanosarcina cf. burmensis CCALA 770]